MLGGGNFYNFFCFCLYQHAETFLLNKNELQNVKLKKKIVFLSYLQ